MTECIINGVDILTMGVHIGEDFISELDKLPSMKAYVSNSSRRKDGTSYILNSPKVEERELTLRFVIHGKNPDDYREKRAQFLELIVGKRIRCHVPFLKTTYNLIYTNCVEYALNRRGNTSRIALKFVEPNPMDRD